MEHTWIVFSLWFMAAIVFLNLIVISECEYPRTTKRHTDIYDIMLLIAWLGWGIFAVCK